MVQNNLSGEGLPLLLANTAGNANLNNWFKGNNSATCSSSPARIEHLVDSLEFTHLGEGLYEMNFVGFPGWWPLDDIFARTGTEQSLVDLGHETLYGGDGGDHNFAFTMHLHRTFTYLADGAEDKTLLAIERRIRRFRRGLQMVLRVRDPRDFPSVLRDRFASAVPDDAKQQWLR